MILKPIQVNLSDVLLADDKYFTLTERDNTKLLAHIPDGEETILTIQDNLNIEWVKATNQCGTIVLERGLDFSEPRKFPKGSCVFFEASIPVIKWLICNHDCCGGKCELEPVTLQRNVLPTGIVGHSWAGYILYKGSLPIVYDVSDLPDWMSVEYEEHAVRLSGTPTASGTFSFVVSATNAQGTALVTNTFKVIVIDN